MPALAAGIHGLLRAPFKTGGLGASHGEREFGVGVHRSYFLRLSEVEPLSIAFLICSRMAGSVLTMSVTVFCSSSPVHGLMSRSCCFASARNSASFMVASNA